jgi:hypothetical protein
MWTYIEEIDVMSGGMYHCPKDHLISDLFMELTLSTSVLVLHAK